MCVCVGVGVCVCVCACVLSLVCMVVVIFVYVDRVLGFHCLVGCFSMIVWTPAVLSVLYASVLYFCICTCSVQFSMCHIERCSRSTLIIIITIVAFGSPNSCWAALICCYVSDEIHPVCQNSNGKLLCVCCTRYFH